MRNEEIGKVKPGMIMGESLYSFPDGRCLVAENVILSQEIINRLAKLNHKYIIIKDENEVDTDEDIISKELKRQMIRSIISVFGVFSKGEIRKQDEKKASKEIERFKSLVQDVVDEIIGNKDCVKQLINIRNYDDNTFNHSLEVAELSIIIGINMNFERIELRHLAEAAILHDVGKIAIPIEIINKPGKLTKEEFDIVKTHPRLGREILESTGKFELPVLMGTQQHHERFDGKGYPMGIDGTKISKIAKVISVADDYSAMTSKRSYKEAFKKREVFEYLYIMDGQHDPEVLAVLFSKIPVYEIDEEITISTGEKAVVIQNNVSNLLRPIIQIIKNEKSSGKIIDLLDRQFYNITIES